MAEKVCRHEDLEYLGSQRAGAGVNRYFRCRECGGVIIIPPESEKAYFVRGVKRSEEPR